MSPPYAEMFIHPISSPKMTKIFGFNTSCANAIDETAAIRNAVPRSRRGKRWEVRILMLLNDARRR
jgi:hypothetical protein